MKKIKRIVRKRKLTAQEAEKYDKIREEVYKEFMPNQPTNLRHFKPDEQREGRIYIDSLKQVGYIVDKTIDQEGHFTVSKRVCNHSNLIGQKCDDCGAVIPKDSP